MVLPFIWGDRRRDSTISAIKVLLLAVRAVTVLDRSRRELQCAGRQHPPHVWSDDEKAHAHWLIAAAGSAQAVDLFDNGAATSGGLSVIRSGGTLLGAGAQGSIPNLVADDFSVGGNGWNVESLSFFSYQTGAASTFTFTSVVWSVISGDVNTGTVVASGTSTAGNGGLQGYRVSATSLTDTNRAVFRVNADVTDFALPAGDYWVRWGITGTLASGPWAPPTAAGTVGNAEQSLGNGAYAPLADAGDGLGIELPFIIQGTVVAVPEPSTYALMLMGVLGLLGVSRRRVNKA